MDSMDRIIIVEVLKKYGYSFYANDETHVTLTKNERGTWDEYYDYKIIINIDKKTNKIKLEILDGVGLSKEEFQKYKNEIENIFNRFDFDIIDINHICTWFLLNCVKTGCL